MRLYLSEKPGVGADIATALGGESQRKKGFIEGNGWRVAWLWGHFYELAPPHEYSEKWSRFDIDTLPMLPEQFKYNLIKDCREQAEIIWNLMRSTTEVVLATDGEQEGQLIGEIFLREAKWEGPTLRMWFSDLNQPALKRALANLKPNSEYYGLYQAALCRQTCDWIVGLNFTRLYTSLAERAGYSSTIPAGRVQSVLLHLIAERNRQIKNFSAGTYYELEARLRLPNGEEVVTEVPIPSSAQVDNKYCLEPDKLAPIIRELSGQNAQVTGITRLPSRKSPPLPFSQTDLQMYADKEWQLDPARTLELSQALYEKHKVLTYPRTSCNYYETEQLKQAPFIVKMLASLSSNLGEAVHLANLKQHPSTFDSSQISADHAHAAIAPTGTKVDLRVLSRDEQNIFNAVALRYIAQFCSDFSYETTEAIIQCNGHQLRLKGTVVLEAGWKRILTDKDDEQLASPLPPIKMNDTVMVTEVRIVQKKTKAPKRYSQGAILAIMQNATAYLRNPKLKVQLNGTACLGTDATRAGILQKLIDRKLITKKAGENVLDATAMGLMADSVYTDTITSPDLTAIWEIHFRRINRDPNLADQFRANVRQWVTKQIEQSKKLRLKTNPLARTCYVDECEGVMTRIKRKPKEATDKQLRDEFFWKCNHASHYRDDDGGKPVAPLEGEGTPCPQCKKPQITRLGKKAAIKRPRRGEKPQQRDRRYLSCGDTNCRSTRKTSIPKKPDNPIPPTMPRR